MPSQGPLSPGTLADDASNGTVAWSHPSNAASSDNSYATVVGGGTDSHRLNATTFGFTVPAGATINGIVVEVERKSSSSNRWVDTEASLLKAGFPVGGNLAVAEYLPTSDVYKTYGSSSDLWGTTWTAAEVNASNFGFIYVVQNAGASATASVDHIRVTVHYTETGATGSGAISGGGSLTASGFETPTPSGSGSISGGGHLTASGAPGGVTILSGGGVLVGSGTKAAEVSALLSGGGSLIGAGIKDPLVSGSLSGGGALVGAGTKNALVSGVLSGAGTLRAFALTPSASSEAAAGLFHRFRSLTGDERYLPDPEQPIDALKQRVSEFGARSQAPGGFVDATGLISPAEFAAHPEFYTWGAEWTVLDADDSNRVVWHGRMTDPQSSGTNVRIHAQGDGKLADKEFAHLLFQTRDESRWTAADSDPHNYDVDKQIQANVNGRKIVFRVRKKEVFKRNNAGTPTAWATGVVFWAPEVNLKRIAFTIDKERSSSEYEIRLRKATGPDGALTTIATYPLSTGAPTAIDETFTDNPDLLYLELRRSSVADKARAFRVSLENIKVNGPFTTGDNYKTHEVVSDIAERIGATPTVQTSTVNALPLDIEGSSAGSALDEIALLDDWYWGVEHNGSVPVMVYQPWDHRTYTLAQRTTWEPIPLERFNKCRGPYRYPGGVRDWVTKTADPDPLAGVGSATMQVDLEDPLPPKVITEAFCQNIADYLAPIRYAGTVTFSEVEESGVAVSGRRVRAGDTLVLAEYDDIALRVVDVTYGPVFTSVTFASGHPLLDRVLAKRHLLLARGRSNADATLREFDLERPNSPASVTLAFKEAEVRGGKRKFHAVLDWAEVTEDIEGNGTAIQRYVAQFRPVDSGGTPIPESQGGGIRRVVVDRKNLDDPEVDDLPTKAILRNVEHPHLWRWQGRVLAVDVLKEKSHFSPWTTRSLPSAFAPDTPTSLTMDVDQHWARIKWEANDLSETDADGAASFARKLRGFKIKLLKSGVQVYPDSGWKKIGPSTHTRIRVQKPGSATYTFQIKAVDHYGNESSVASTTGNKVDPPTQSTAPTITFDRGGKKGIRAKVSVPAYSQSYLDDDIDKLVVQLQAEESNPSDSDPRMRRVVDVDPSDLTSAIVVPFGKIKAGERVRARYRLKDTKGHASGWSNWSTTETATVARKPGAVRNLDKDVDEDGKFRHITWKWDPPNVWSDGSSTGFSEDEVAGYNLTPRKNGVEQSSKTVTMHKSTRYTMKVPTGGGTWTLKVEPLGWDNNSVGTSSISATGVTPGGVEGAEIDVDDLNEIHDTLTAGTFKTADSGKRIELSNSASEEINWYNTLGNLGLRVYLDSSDIGRFQASSKVRIACTSSSGEITIGDSLDAVGFFDATPVTQRTDPGDHTVTSGTDNDGNARAKINDILDILRDYGLI